MPGNSIPFHIQHIARPAHIARILSTVSSSQLPPAKIAHLQLTEGGYAITLDGVRRSYDLGSKLGLFNKVDSSTYTMTSRGDACQNLALYRPEVYSDVMHFLLFAAWEMNGHQDYWSWSYARTCEIYWRDRPAIKDRKAFFGQLAAEAAKEFPHLDPVVGTETIYAVTNWLRELSPPFFVNDEDKLVATQEREWFSTELALLAVSYLYAARRVATQTPLLLDRATVEMLQPLCLTSTERIMAMLEIAAQTYPMLAIHTGEWGSSVVLQQDVDIPSLI